MFIVSPSMLSADFWNLGKEIGRIEKTKAQYLHIDVMDGAFVPNISFGQPVIRSIRPHTSLFFDVHLMVNQPARYIKSFAEAGADLITIHLEAQQDVGDALDQIHGLGLKAGLSVKPMTPAEGLYPYLHKTDMVLVMTVEPGFGGQRFMHEMLPKIRQIKDYIDENQIICDIEVDGGINHDTVRAAAQHGANVFVAGNYIFLSEDPGKAVETLLTAARDAV